MAFALISTVVLALSLLISDQITSFLVTRGTFNYADWTSYHGFITHIFAHADWGHLFGNFVFILLLGPLLEEKFGSGRLLLMILVTALLTGVINVILFDDNLLGASGIVLMLITLGSYANAQKGRIPLTFVLVVVLFFSQEIESALTQDNISHFAHILAGMAGSVFGFFLSWRFNRRSQAAE